MDGTKIEANANKYSFVWSKAVEKNSRKLVDKILRIVPEIAKRYSLNEEISLTQCLQILMQTAAMQKIQFVHGKGKRKTQQQRDIDLLIELGDKRQAYRESMSKFGKRKSYSKTDNDATFMRMKEDYMKNGQLKPGYNVQIMVESEYIVGVGLFPNPTDTTTLIPFMERVYNKTKRRIENLIADAGYASEENCYHSEKNRTIRVSHKLNEQNRKAEELITTEQGILLRQNRSIQVEGAFGVIKQDYHFKRFLTRGKEKTETQFLLLAFAFNINKLCNRLAGNRFNQSLFPLSAA